MPALPIVAYNYLIHWKDGIEILLFSTIIYYFSLWLRNDRHKNLLGYFYLYCITLLVTHYSGLSTINHFLMLTSPIAIMLFIVFHQELLQRNFVMLRTATTLQKDDSKNWLEIILGSCIATINNNKNIWFALEHHDSLDALLTTSLPMQVDIQKNVLSMLIESDAFEPHKMIWINSQGKILGINTQWKIDLQENWVDTATQSLTAWQQDALFFTAKTDAIIFKMDAQKRTFDIVAQGKIFNNVNATHALQTIKKYITPPESSKKGDFVYDAHVKKSNRKQRST